jgi:hypothetical protein
LHSTSGQPSPPLRDCPIVGDGCAGLTNVRFVYHFFCWRTLIDRPTRFVSGQYNNPVCVVGFNAVEGWSRDVSEDVAHELRECCADQRRVLPPRLIRTKKTDAVSGGEQTATSDPLHSGAFRQSGTRGITLPAEGPVFFFWLTLNLRD